MKDLFEVKKFEVLELDRETFNSGGYSIPGGEVPVGGRGATCSGIGDCIAFTIQGAYEMLREDIEFQMHNFIDTNEDDKVYVSPFTKVDGYENTYLVVASIRKARDKDSKYVTEFIIVEGDKPIKIN